MSLHSESPYFYYKALMRRLLGKLAITFTYPLAKGQSDEMLAQKK
jgi:hypothetical protein